MPLNLEWSNDVTKILATTCEAEGIQAQRGGDIPIDLSTRRVILYRQSKPERRQDLKLEVSKAIREIVTTYGLSPAQETKGLDDCTALSEPVANLKRESAGSQEPEPSPP